jgi:hypothetical protein
MRVEEVAAYVESLPQVRRTGPDERPVWQLHGRLVARLVDPTTLIVRVPLSEREALIDPDPDGFGVPPRLEAHHKVEAYLDRADPAVVRTAIRLAWDLQHHGDTAS